MKKVKFTLIILMAVVTVCLSLNAQIPLDYYSSLNGKSGSELKTAVHNLIKNATVLSYGSGSGCTWQGFYSTDRAADNSVIDRYSNDVRYFGDEGSSVSGMNIEHSFPKSWWGGTTVQAYKDLYNLMPCESSINSSKSNYPMGTVTTVKTDNGCTKIGTGSNGYQLWEPADKWKGDFARGYMYMATAYQDYTWSGTQALQILQQGDYPTLQEWAYTLYIKWANTDKVDEIEIARNDAVSKIQGNRNPFVDFPNLMEYIWGDSINYAFNIYTTVKSTDYTSGGGSTIDETIYSELFTKGNTGDFVPQQLSGSFTVWTQDNTYGWKGTGYDSDNNVKYATEAVLVGPELDLTEYASATLNFNHVIRYFGSNYADVLSVEVWNGDYITKLSDFQWPTNNDWVFVDSGDIPLNAYCGNIVHIAFRYKSDTSYAGTWEIKKMTVTGKRGTTGIDEVANDVKAFDPTMPFKAYSIDGRVVNPDTHKGIMIIKQGNVTLKMMK
ncbi:MAG: endonuclease [Prevotella sp.]